MSQTLLDVVVDDAFRADLAKLLARYRNEPVADPALHSIVAAVKYERALNADMVGGVIQLMERRRVHAIDLELNDAVDRLRIAHGAMHERYKAKWGEPIKEQGTGSLEQGADL